MHKGKLLNYVNNTLLQPSVVQFLLLQKKRKKEKEKKSVVQLCEEKCTLTHDRRYITLIIFDLAKMINHH